MIACILTALAAAALGYGVAWRRPDLALAPGRTALEAGACGAAAGAALAVAGAGWALFLLFAALAPLAAIDARRMILPDDLTLPLIALGPALGFLGGDGWGRLAGAALGYLALWGLAALWRAEAMGRGDAKLLAAIGGFLGWEALPEVAFIGALAGIAWALLRHGRAAARRPVPFGPALIGGALASALFGPVFG